MKFKEYINEITINENPFEKKLRIRRGYPVIIKVNANKLAKDIYLEQGEKLAWNTVRSEEARKREFFWSYPNVSIRKSDGKIEVLDGRHRIALAVERNEPIEISCPRKDALKLKEKYGEMVIKCL